MKIAICFYGKTGSKARDGMGEQLPLESLHRNFKNKFLKSGHDVDIYIHSWSTEKKDEILHLYQPKDYIIEDELFDLGEKSRIRRDKREARVDSVAPNIDENFWDHGIFNSRWYSNSQTIGLMLKSGVEYDFVMVTRFDLVWSVPFDFDSLNPDEIYVCGPKLARNGITCDEVMATPISRDPAMTDYWFVSGRDNIKSIGELTTYKAEHPPHYIQDRALSNEFLGHFLSYQASGSHCALEAMIAKVADRATFKYEVYIDCGMARHIFCHARNHSQSSRGYSDYWSDDFEEVPSWLRQLVISFETPLLEPRADEGPSRDDVRRQRIMEQERIDRALEPTPTEPQARHGLGCPHFRAEEMTVDEKDENKLEEIDTIDDVRGVRYYALWVIKLFKRIWKWLSK